MKSFGDYQRLYQQSLANPTQFWGQMATEQVAWSKPFKTVQSGEISNAKWFEEGELNACYNCVDRHVATRGDQRAIIWESDDGKEVRELTYKELHQQVQKMANVLKSLGANKDSAVVLYMPMTPEVVIAMLACARIGVPHCSVFAGFSQEALHERIVSSGANIVITADELLRAGKHIPLKPIVDKAVEGCDKLKHVLVLRRTGSHHTKMVENRDIWWHDALSKAPETCPPVPMRSEDPLFYLFTSGSTGKPKGLVHSTGGYLTYAAVTTKYVFDIKPDTDIFCCTADAGWITGHTYLVYGPLSLGVTNFIFEGHPTSLHNGRYWELVEKHKITIFYTSPTAVRARQFLAASLHFLHQ